MTNQSQFVKEVDKAYAVLWKLFKGENGKGCNFDSEKEDKLLRILNKIDDELGRQLFLYIKTMDMFSDYEVNNGKINLR